MRSPFRLMRDLKNRSDTPTLHAVQWAAGHAGAALNRKAPQKGALTSTVIASQLHRGTILLTHELICNAHAQGIAKGLARWPFKNSRVGSSRSEFDQSRIQYSVALSRICASSIFAITCALFHFTASSSRIPLYERWTKVCSALDISSAVFAPTFLASSIRPWATDASSLASARLSSLILSTYGFEHASAAPPGPDGLRSTFGGWLEDDMRQDPDGCSRLRMAKSYSHMATHLQADQGLTN